MPEIWKKLDLEDQHEVVVLNSPPSFQAVVDSLSTVQVARDLAPVSKVESFIAFVTQRAEIEPLAASLGQKAHGDPVVWFAYPKGRSTRYECDFSRDTGWQPLGDAGFEAVRQVAIDENWSALRFRRVENIKAMRRDQKRAMTTAGKAKVSTS